MQMPGANAYEVNKFSIAEETTLSDSVSLLTRQQPDPVAFERPLEADQCGRQHIRLSSLDLLNRPQVEINLFGELLLRYFLPHSFTPDVRTERFKLLLLDFC